jgi:hypothetical protein
MSHKSLKRRLHCGSAELGYRSSLRYGGSSGISLGTAMAISAAAANSGMGFYSSPLKSFLLTLINARLGWWLGNPSSRDAWKRDSPLWACGPMLLELSSLTNRKADFVNLSDGGHFDNTAVYEMLRRRCSHILLIDADSTQNGISNLARRARVDLGVELHTKSAVFEDDLPCETYSVHYPSCSDSKAFTGTLVRVYPKLGKPSHWSTFESCEYKRVNEDFPNASLINQFFTESAFEAYRNLGFAILSEVIWRRKAPALRPKTPGIDAWTSLFQV